MRYAMSRNNVTLVAGNDLLTVISAANRRLVLVEIKIDGQDLVSTQNLITFSRSTGGTTPTGAITATPEIVEAVAAVFTNATAWVAQPTAPAAGTIALLTFGINTFGGKDRWFSVPSERFEVRNTEQWSLRAVSGAGVVSLTVIVDEL